MYVQIRMYIYMCVHENIHMYTHVQTYACTNACIHINENMHKTKTYVHAPVYTFLTPIFYTGNS